MVTEPSPQKETKMVKSWSALCSHDDIICLLLCFHIFWRKFNHFQPKNPHSSGPSQTFGWVGPGRYAPLNIPNIFKAAGINTKWIAEVTPFFSICSIVCTFKFDNNHLNFSRTTRSSRLASHIPLPRRRRRLTFPTLPPPLPTM